MVLLSMPWGIPCWKKPYETARKYTIALLRPYHKEVWAESRIETIRKFEEIAEIK